MEFTTIAIPSSQLELMDQALTSNLVMYRAFVHEAVIPEIGDFLVKARKLQKLEAIAPTWKIIEETILSEIEAVLWTDFDVAEKTELASLYLDRRLATLEEDEEAPVDVIVANIVKCLCTLPSDAIVTILSKDLMPRILTLPLAIHYSVLPTLPQQLITEIILSPTRSDSTREVVAVRKAIVQLIQCAADIADIHLLARTVYQAVSVCISTDEVDSAPKATSSGTLLICESVLREILRLLICEKSESRCVELFIRVVQPVAILVAPAAVASDSLGFFVSEAVLSYSPLMQAVPEYLKSRMSAKGLDCQYLGDGCRGCDEVLMRIVFGPTGKRSETTAEVDSWLEGRGAWLLLFDLLSPEEQNQILLANEELSTSFCDTLPSSLPRHFHEWGEEDIQKQLNASSIDTSPPPTASANVVSSTPNPTSLAATSGSTAAAPAPSTPAPPPPQAATLFSPRAAILDQVVGSFPRPSTPQFQPLVIPFSPSTARPAPIVPSESPVQTPLDAVTTNDDVSQDFSFPSPPRSLPAGRGLFRRTQRLELSEILNMQSDLGKHPREDTSSASEEGSEPDVGSVDIPSAKRAKRSAPIQPVQEAEEWTPLRGNSANASVASMYKLSSEFGSQNIPVIKPSRLVRTPPPEQPVVSADHDQGFDNLDLVPPNGLPLPRPSREGSFVTGSSATATTGDARIDNADEERKTTKVTILPPPVRQSSQLTGSKPKPLNKFGQSTSDKTSTGVPRLKPSSKLPSTLGPKTTRSQTRNAAATIAVPPPEATMPPPEVLTPPTAPNSHQPETQTQTEELTTAVSPGDDVQAAPADIVDAPAGPLVPGQNGRGRGTNRGMGRGRGRGIDQARGGGRGRGRDVARGQGRGGRGGARGRGVN